MKKNIIMIVCALIIFAGGFFTGFYYQKSKASKVTANGAPTGDMANFKNGNSSNSGNGRSGTPPTGGGPNGGGGGGVSGEIVSISDDSMTVKTDDGSTKIVYLSDSTTISKNTTGTISDLTTGTKVMVSGTTNTDNSVTGKTVMIQPATTE